MFLFDFIWQCICMSSSQRGGILYLCNNCFLRVFICLQKLSAIDKIDLSCTNSTIAPIVSFIWIHIRISVVASICSAQDICFKVFTLKLQYL